MPKPKMDPGQFQNDDQEIEKPSSYLETEKKHKDWYDSNQMGKQRKRPINVIKEIKKRKYK